jgi:mycothiol system anti-sigma-R factor
VTSQPGGSEAGEQEGDCSGALHELYTFLDGELTVERRTHISRHLDDCHGCLEAFDFEAELRIVVSQKCREEVPESLRRRVAEALGGLEQTTGE